MLLPGLLIGFQAPLQAQNDVMLQGFYWDVPVDADIVLNHIYGGEDNLEPNPAVNAYVFDEARRHGKQFTPYPTNEVLWRLPKAAAGDYYLKIKGYHLDYEAGPEARAYDLQVDYVASGWKDAYTWELEPNNGQGTFQDFPSSGQTLRAFIQDEHDVDVFKVSVPGGQDLVFRLSPRFSHETGWWSGDPTHGYYPFELWYEGEDLAPTHLQADGRVYVQAPSRSFAVYVPQKDLSRP